jgi:hypothetical protein
MKRRQTLLAIMSAALLLLAIQVSTFAQKRLVNVVPQGMGLRFEPTIAYSKVTLTVSGPNGVISSETFDAGITPTLTLFTSKGARLPEGVYTYELSFAPVLGEDIKQALAKSREQGTEAAVSQDLRNRGVLPTQPLVESGSFLIQGGQLFVNGGTEPTTPRPKTPPTGSDTPHPNDVVTADDAIIQGSACIGLDCVNNETFGFDTLRLKENNNRIQFDDTSTSAGFATNNWQIRANDSASGGASFLGFVDQGATGNSDTGNIVFSVEAGAPVNALKVASSGKLGLRTATPGLDIHMNTSDTPAIRFEQNNSGGFTAQTWDIGANEANFFVRDLTGGSRLPFRVRPGAPTSSIDIAASGNVGIGTASPLKKLQVGSGADTPVTTVDGLYITNDGNTGFAVRDSTNDIEFQFAIATSVVSGALMGSVTNHPLVLRTNAVERMRIEAGGNIGIGTPSPTDLLSVNGTASKPGGGSWAVFSDKRLKNIKGNFNSGLASILKLQPLRYQYKSDNALGLKSNEEYVGFEAQAVQKIIPEAVTRNANGYLMVNNDPIMWTMLNAIKEQQKQIETLKAEVNKLKARQHRRR